MPAGSLKFATADGIKIAFKAPAKLADSHSLQKNIIAAACGGSVDFSHISDPVIRVDFRGQGESESPKELSDYSINGYASDTFAVADAAGVKTPVLLGYSHAADGATLAALNEPDRVQALILVEPAILVDKAHLAQRVRLLEEGKIDEALRLTFQFANPRISKDELKAAVKQGKEFYGRDGKAFLGESLARLNSPIDEGRLSTISVPTLVIGGTRSSIRSNVARVAKAIPNASVVWVNGADHFLTNKTKEVSAIITAFVASLG
jgi:pimeloyl-ACP methyl ester carboxylesterase